MWIWGNFIFFRGCVFREQLERIKREFGGGQNEAEMLEIMETYVYIFIDISI